MTYFLNEILFSLMFMRVYFLIRTILTYSGWLDEFGRKVSKAYGHSASFEFAIKSQMQNSPAKTVATIFFGTMFLYSYIIRIFEIQYFRSQNDMFFQSFTNSFYFIIISVSTIGYGDISPQTMPGVIICLSLALWGAILMSLYVITFATMWIMSEEHTLSHKHINHTQKAAKTIFLSLKYHMAKKKLKQLE